MKKSRATLRPRLGWRERVSLPALGINNLVAKLDTGAKTSALDAQNIELISVNGKSHIQFDMVDAEENGGSVRRCEAELLELRAVTDSGGHVEQRYVIETELKIADVAWTVEVTLTQRSSMKYRMLVGRSALRRRFVIDPAKSFYAQRGMSSARSEPIVDAPAEKPAGTSHSGYLDETWTDSPSEFDEEE